MVFLRFLLLISAVGGIWLLCGLGPYMWVRAAVPHRGSASLGLCAGLGLAMLGVAATQVFYLELSPVWTIALAAGGSAALLVAAAKYGRGGAWTALVGLLRAANEDREFWLTGLVLAAIVFLPGYRGGFGQPYRIGIDQVGYAVTAQYLRDGKTPSALRREIVRSTGQPNEEMALNAHVTALNFNTAVAAEFLLKAHRICYPLYVAGVTQLLGLDMVVNYQYCLLAVPWGCTLLLLLWFFRDVAAVPELAARTMAAALSLNANLLNILFEGQHAQVAICPLLIIFFGALLVLRGSDTLRGGGVLVALTGAGIFSFYSDSFIALGIVGIALWGADLVSRDWVALRRTTFFGLAVVAGLVPLNRYAYEWVEFILRHLANLNGGNGGWPQPYWASPAEIVGYFSIYQGPLGSLVPRPDGVVWAETGVVIIMLGALLFGGYRTWRDWRIARYWLVPALVTAWVYVDLRWIKGFHNYGYMKVYTLLLLPLAGLHWSSLHGLISYWVARWELAEIWAERLLAGVVAIAIAVGVLETSRYVRTSERLPAEARRIMVKMARELDLSQYALLTYPEGGIGMATFAAYGTFNWLNISWSDKYLSVHADKSILIVLVGSAQPYFRNALRTGRVLYRDGEVLVIRADRRVRELNLPECRILADKPTTGLALTHEQFPLFSAFLREQLEGKRPVAP